MDSQVALLPAAEDDLALLYRLTSDPSATGEHEWYGWQNPWTYRRRWAENGLLDEGSGVLVVARGEDRIGFVAWHKQPTARTSFCWNVAIVLMPEARGRGYGTQAQRLLVRYLFSHTQVNRIEAGTEITNLAEQRALEKAGFTREGVLRGACFRAGMWRDMVSYSILRTDPEPG